MTRNAIVVLSALFVFTVGTCLWYAGNGQLLSATILTTNSSDSLTTFRTNVNTSLSNLNAALGASTTTTNVWTALQQFSNASTTLFSCYGPCYFGATATSSFSSAGVLSLASALTAANGGTGYASYTPGDMLYASGATTLTKLASSTGGTILQTSHTTGAPSWVATSSLNVAITDTTGTLGATRGGTGNTTYAQGDMLFAAVPNTLAKLAKNTTATRYIANTGASSGPTWDQINLSNGVTDTLPVANGGTGSTTLSGILLGNATSAIKTLTIGSGLSLAGETLSSTASGSAFPFTAQTWGVSTTTTLGFLSGFLSTASSTIDGNATTTGDHAFGSIRIPSLTSALLQTDGNGLAAEYAGTSCTNQFMRSLSALGVATCATVGAADVSLANLTATDSTLTFSGTYNGSTARTIGLNLGNANTWTALQTFGAASTTNFTIGSYFQLPTASSFSNNMKGTLAFDDTSGNLIMGTTTSASTAHVVIGSATTTLYAATASTTAFISGSILDLPSHSLAQVATKLWCKVSSGTSFVINLSDGTNDTNAITCTTTGTEYALTSNNSFTAYEAIRLEFGAKTGDTGYLSFRVMGYRTSD